MYKDAEIQILNNKALESIKAVHRNGRIDAITKFLTVDDILIKLEKDIKKLNR